MAIYTRFGSKIEIVSVYEDEAGQLWVRFRREDDSESETNLSELRADDGFVEVWKALRALLPGQRIGVSALQ